MSRFSWVGLTTACLVVLVVVLRPAQARSAEPVKKAKSAVQLEVVVAEVRDGLVPVEMRSTTLESPLDRQLFLSFLEVMRGAGLAELVAEANLVTPSGRQTL